MFSNSIFDGVSSQFAPTLPEWQAQMAKVLEKAAVR